MKIIRNGERGAALMTVILASLLLGTACIALLSAVGASSQNNTDALSEAKAYWAAESGLQATINVLRNTKNMTYSTALSQQLAGTLPVTGPVTIGETKYAVTIADPDNSTLSTTFSIAGEFEQGDGSFAPTREYTNANGKTTFSYNGVTSDTYDHPAGSLSFGSFSIVRTGTATPAPMPPSATPLRFRIAYRMTAPRTATTYIRGKITSTGDIEFDAYTIILGNSPIKLCKDISCSPAGTAFSPKMKLPVPTLTAQPLPLYGTIAPLDPYRLLVKSTGYGPNGSIKMLEAVIQKNYMNDFGSAAAISMLGANPVIQTGDSGNMDIIGGAVPSIVVADPAGIATLKDPKVNKRYENMQPPPEIYNPSDLPLWQQSPANMDAMIQQLRQTAMNSGRYFKDRSPTSTEGWGNFAQGTGITFCEGNCNMSAVNGGGILVVTGTFSSSGNPSFNGLVIITGPGGWDERAGGGNKNGTFTGSVVIAPYDPTDLSKPFLSPRYIQKGGSDDTVWDDDTVVDDALNGTKAITDFVIGIAEK